MTVKYGLKAVSSVLLACFASAAVSQAKDPWANIGEGARYTVCEISESSPGCEELGFARSESAAMESARSSCNRIQRPWDMAEDMAYAVRVTNRQTGDTRQLDCSELGS